MNRMMAAVFGLFLALGGQAAAQDPGAPVVIELYTSQGCSSCPPADRLLERLSTRPGVIALSLHVDYWDYLGWKDSLAQPKFSERQRSYARVAGARSVYTPQMIVAGVDHLVGARPARLEELIRKHAARAAQARVQLARKGDRVAVSAEASRVFNPPAIVQLVRYLPHARVEIGRGENAGRVIDYVNVVTDWAQVAEWDGRAPITLDLPAPGDQPVVVIVQEQGPGRILGAAAIR
ncbi:hypothetical protein LV82_02278 [Albidovulum inexpectatum]|uniref:Secreted protein n=1 Tax=Albidovulum inexpectatum TaxID=196587 RepID=A0A2S5JER8_9RHOB|nr:DUF1223 domain-containing protein [Albidovulum inexpectatum]PPB79996.1 hypothetical protein LV82_02278 [Albidovulum inexpectatum]